MEGITLHTENKDLILEIERPVLTFVVALVSRVVMMFIIISIYKYLSMDVIITVIL